MWGSARTAVAATVCAVVVSGVMVALPLPEVGAATGDVTIAAGGNALGAIGAALHYVDSATVDADGHLWIVDRKQRILEFLPGSTVDSQPVSEILTGMFMYDIAVDGSGRLYVVTSGTNAMIHVFDSNGNPRSPSIPTNGSEIEVLPDGVYFDQRRNPAAGIVAGVYRVPFDGAGDLVTEPDGTIVPELVVPTTSSVVGLAGGVSGGLFVAFSGGTLGAGHAVWRFGVGDLPVAPAQDGVYASGTKVAESTGSIAVDAENNVFVNTGINSNDDPTVEGVIRVPPPGPDGVPRDAGFGNPKLLEVLGLADLVDAGLESPDCQGSPPSAAGVICTGGTTKNKRIAVDHQGDLFVPLAGYSGPNERNVVVRVEGVGASVPQQDPVEICVGDADTVEGDADSAGRVDFPLTLSEPLPSNVTVQFTVESGSATVGTGPDADLAGDTESFTLLTGATDGVLSIDVIGDELAEADETFTVRLVSATSPGAVLTCNEATGTIIDDDETPTITAGVDSPVIDEGSTTRLTSVVTDDEPDDLTFTWTPATGLDDPTAAEPIFTGPDDGPYVFTAEVCDSAEQCQTSSPVSVDVVNVAPVVDTPLAAVSGNAATPATLDVSFADPGEFDTFDLEVDWGDGTPPETTVGVTSPAQAEHEYATPGDYDGEVCVIDDDNVIGEDNGRTCEPFTAAIGAPLLPSVSINDASVVEGDPDGSPTVMTFTVELTETATAPVTVGVSTTDGTATSVDDFTPLDTTVTIPVGQDSATVDVAITRDLEAEPEETFTVALTDPTGALLGDGTAQGVIVDDDICDVVGTQGDDDGQNRLVGTPGDEVICGFGGNDVIDGGGGNDTILGGSGIDTVVFPGHPGPVTVDLRRGTATGGGFAYTLDSIENATGTPANDRLIGNDGQNRLTGLGGNDTISGLGGDDVLIGNGGNDRILGGNGNDTAFGNEGNDWLFGQNGNDELYGLQGDDRVFGGNGNDIVSGGTATGPDPSGGNDWLFGGAGDDQLFGGAGNDWLFGQNGNDALAGGDGYDRLFGGRNVDSCFTGERNLSCERT